MSTPTPAPILRDATPDDLEAINEIYNHFVGYCTCTYQEKPESIEDRRHWFASHDAQHPVLVGEIDGKVVGWASLSRFHARSAYRYTVEDSIYIHPIAQGKGLGRMMIEELIRRARALGHRSMVAGIDALQEGSLALHERAGFVRVGHLKQVGFKFGRWLDVIYMQLELKG